MLAARRRLASLIGIIACSIGCGTAEPEPTTLRLDDVPGDVMRIAREQLPGVTFDTVWKKPSRTYEIRGKQKWHDPRGRHRPRWHDRGGRVAARRFNAPDRP